MLKIGDTVKVIGKTVVGSNANAEPIRIGTICRVVGTYSDDKKGLIVGIIPETIQYSGREEFWYLSCDVEKCHSECPYEDICLKLNCVGYGAGIKFQPCDWKLEELR